MSSFSDKLKNLFLKKNIEDKKETSTNVNWYEDRFQTTIVQRNLLFLAVILLLLIIFASVFTILEVSSSRTVKPFVVEIEDKSGIPNVIRPYIPAQFTNQYAYDEAIRRYFLLKYLRAREEYNYHTFNRDYFTVVRSMSDKEIYSQFRTDLYSSGSGSPLTYADRGKISITIRSIKHLPPSSGKGYLVQVAFVRNITSPGKTYSENKIATIGYDYRDLSMNDEEREINPLGFQVISYRVDDYTL